MLTTVVTQECPTIAIVARRKDVDMDIKNNRTAYSCEVVRPTDGGDFLRNSALAAFVLAIDEVMSDPSTRVPGAVHTHRDDSAVYRAALGAVNHASIEMRTRTQGVLLGEHSVIYGLEKLYDAVGEGSFVFFIDQDEDAGMSNIVVLVARDGKLITYRGVDKIRELSEAHEPIVPS